MFPVRFERIDRMVLPCTPVSTFRFQVVLAILLTLPVYGLAGPGGLWRPPRLS